MVTKKDMAVAILATFCLTSTLFMIMPTRSQTETPEYDPWTDLNDDGIIDIFDIVQVALAFGAEGTPINKTALLLELLNRINSLNNTIMQQQTIINNLNETVVILNNTKGLGTPDYDSGWQSISQGGVIFLTHNLNTTELLVYLIGRYWSGYEWHHQFAFGGSRDEYHNQQGAWWAATNTTINLYRGAQDNASGMPWQYVRVMIWKIPEP